MNPKETPMAFTRRAAMAALGSGLLGIAPGAIAQADYPTKPVRIVLPLAAGSSGDVSTRFFAERLGKQLGQSFIVENLPGANALPAVGAVMRAPADGYTLLQGTSAAISLNPVLVKNLNYDPMADLKPVAGLIRTAQVIAVPADSPLRTLADVVKAAKAAKDPLNSATYGPLYLFAQEWFGSMIGAKFNNIAYKGANEAATALGAGQVDMGFVDYAGVLPLVRGGRVRVIAITSGQRLDDFPDVPTFRESGYPDFVSYAWASLFVRKDVPDAVVNKLADAMARIHASAEVKEFLSKQPAVMNMPLGPAEMRKFQVDEIARLRKIAAAAGIAAQ
jgi:tripartite-type tricarboxylate transporter receptor subunit TctC